MSWVHALVLGVVQGLTEFLPISSSGHLVLVPWLLGWEDFSGQPDIERAFTVALHLGTFVALLVWFRADVVALASGALRGGPDRRRAVLLAVSALPAAAGGALLDASVEGAFVAEAAIGVLLVVFGLVLAAADRSRGSRVEEGFAMRDALGMGLAQVASLLPGVSRSGVTISAARVLGFARPDAARLAFLMGLPVIAGAGLYEAFGVLRAGGLPAGMAAPFVLGAVTSAVTGVAAIGAVLRFVRTRSFIPFVAYRVLAGAAVIALSL